MEVPLPILGSYFTYRDASILTTVGGLNAILNPDPSRWGIVFWNAGAAAATEAVWWTADGGITGGVPLLQTTLPWLITFPSHGSLVQAGWWGSSNPVGTNIGCIEIRYLPPPSAQVLPVED